MPVHLRGDIYNVSPMPTPRGVPSLLTGVLASPTYFHSVKAAGLNWPTGSPIRAIRSPSRVMVNRLWQWHFGRGIVGTPSNFGKLGERPTQSAAARLAGRRIRRERLVDQAHSAADHHQQHVSHEQPAASAEAEQIDPDNQAAVALLAKAARSRIALRRDGQHDQHHRAAGFGQAARCGEGQEPRDVRARFAIARPRGSAAKCGRCSICSTTIHPAFRSRSDRNQSRRHSRCFGSTARWLNTSPIDLPARLLKMDKLDDRHRVEMAYLLALGGSPTEAAVRQCIELSANA